MKTKIKYKGAIYVEASGKVMDKLKFSWDKKLGEYVGMGGLEIAFIANEKEHVAGYKKKVLVGSRTKEETYAKHPRKSRIDIRVTKGNPERSNKLIDALLTTYPGTHVGLTSDAYNLGWLEISTKSKEKINKIKSAFTQNPSSSMKKHFRGYYQLFYTYLNLEKWKQDTDKVMALKLKGVMIDSHKTWAISVEKGQQ